MDNTRDFKLKIVSPKLPAAPKYIWVGAKYDHYTDSDSRRYYITDEDRACIFACNEMNDDQGLNSWLTENGYTYQQVFI